MEKLNVGLFEGARCTPYSVAKFVLVIAKIHGCQTVAHQLWRRYGGVQNEFHVERCKAVSPTIFSVRYFSYVFSRLPTLLLSHSFHRAYKNNFNYVFFFQTVYVQLFIIACVSCKPLLSLYHDVLARMLIVSNETRRHV